MKSRSVLLALIVASVALATTPPVQASALAEQPEGPAGVPADAGFTQSHRCIVNPVTSLCLPTPVEEALATLDDAVDAVLAELCGDASLSNCVSATVCVGDRCVEV